MKRLLLPLVAVLLLASCNSDKTVHIADFTVTYPSIYTLENVQNNFPDDVIFNFTGEEGQSGLYSVVYYDNDELDYLEALYEGMPGFVENKIIERFGAMDALEYLTIEEADEIQWTDDNLCAYINVNGFINESGAPWQGAVLNYMHDGAFVSAMIFGFSDKDVEDLMQIAFLKFDEGTGNYHPHREELPDED